MSRRHLAGRTTTRGGWTNKGQRGGTPPQEGPPVPLRADEPPELAELRDLFELCLEEVGDALMVEPHLAGRRDGELAMLASLRRLQAGLRAWIEGPMQRDQRRLTSREADELRALVTGGPGEPAPPPVPADEHERPARP